MHSVDNLRLLSWSYPAALARQRGGPAEKLREVLGTPKVNTREGGTHMQHNWTNLTLMILTGVVCATIAMAASVKDAGRSTFEKRCASCHALDKIKVGPPMRGVYGRNAGKDPQFTYSDPVKNASVMWDESTLDRWLTDTESVIPGNDMPFRMNDAADRANIIAYLRQLSGK